MVQRRSRARFPQQPRPRGAITEHARRQDLDRDVPVQALVMAVIHLAHATRAQERENFISAEPIAWSKAHRNT
jgi:hypothetical protein